MYTTRLVAHISLLADRSRSLAEYNSSTDDKRMKSDKKKFHIYFVTTTKLFNGPGKRHCIQHNIP